LVRTFTTVVRERVRVEPVIKNSKKNAEETNPVLLAQLKRRKEEEERANQQSASVETEKRAAKFDKPPALDVPDFMDY